MRFLPALSATPRCAVVSRAPPVLLSRTRPPPSPGLSAWTGCSCTPLAPHGITEGFAACCGRSAFGNKKTTVYETNTYTSNMNARDQGGNQRSDGNRSVLLRAQMRWLSDFGGSAAERTAQEHTGGHIRVVWACAGT